MLEAVDNLFEDGLVEHHLLALHHTRHVGPCQQFAALEADAVATCIEHIHPQLFVEYLAGEDEHFHVRIRLLGVAANLDTHGGAAAQTKVEQHQVGRIALDESPVLRLVLGRSNDFGLGDVVTEDAFSAFQFERNILHDDDFEFFQFHFYCSLFRYCGMS